MTDGEVSAGDASAETDGGAASDGEAGDAYSGVLGTYPYAFRRSESRLLRSYVVVGGLVAALVAVGFTFALVQVMARTVGGSTTTFVRAFVIIVGTSVVVPLMAPVVLVARRHRKRGANRAYDRALAASGYLFVVALYLGLVVSAPPALRDDPSGALAPLVQLLYDLPRAAGVVPLLAAIAVGYLLHRRYR